MIPFKHFLVTAAMAALAACSGNTSLPGLVDDAAEEWQPGACSDFASVERSLQLIIEAGFTASVSELDVQVWEGGQLDQGRSIGDDGGSVRTPHRPALVSCGEDLRPKIAVIKGPRSRRARPQDRADRGPMIGPIMDPDLPRPAP